MRVAPVTIGVLLLSSSLAWGQAGGVEDGLCAGSASLGSSCPAFGSTSSGVGPGVGGGAQANGPTGTGANAGSPTIVATSPASGTNGLASTPGTSTTSFATNGFAGGGATIGSPGPVNNFTNLNSMPPNNLAMSDNFGPNIAPGFSASSMPGLTLGGTPGFSAGSTAGLTPGGTLGFAQNISPALARAFSAQNGTFGAATGFAATP